eukprot:11271434-Ditylum_brightwellii.AAC.1
MDGLKLYLQEAGKVEIQECFYNRWKHGHYMSNVFVFTHDGMIQLMVINLPGDTHDLTAVSQGFIYEWLKQFYNIYGGSDYLVKLSQHDTTSANAYGMLQSKEATSVRQMAKW